MAHTRPGWRRAAAMASDDRATSVPTVTIRSTPAATASATRASAAAGSTLSSAPQPRWQWSSVQRGATTGEATAGRASMLCSGHGAPNPTTFAAGSAGQAGNSGAPLVTSRPPGYWPQAAAPGTCWSVGEPGRPMRRHASAHASGTAGEARIATRRIASSASPSTASTSGPGSSFHGSAASSRPLVSRMSRHVASSATEGAIVAPRLVGGGVTPRRPPPPAASRRGAPAPRRRTSCPPPWPPATRGCRSCWPGRRCSGRPSARRRSRRRAERPRRAGSGSGTRRRRSPPPAGPGRCRSAWPGRGSVFDSFSPPSSRNPWTEMCGQRVDARGQQHGRPVHAVEPEDVLADEVVGGRPPGREPLVVGPVADRRGVVDRARRTRRRSTCFGSHGRGTPHEIDVRLIEKSSRPLRMKPSASLRLASGVTKSGCAAYQSSSGCSKRDSLKK